MKNRWKIILLSILISILSIVVLFVGLPMFINMLFPPYSPLRTSDASIGLMGYIGTIIGCLATIGLGIVATYQTLQANNINKRLLKLEEVSKKTYILFDKEKSSFFMLENGYSCCLAFKKISDSLIVDVEFENGDAQLLDLSSTVEGESYQQFEQITRIESLKVCYIFDEDGITIEFDDLSIQGSSFILCFKIVLTNLHGYTTTQLFNIVVWNEHIVDVKTREM